MNKSACGIVTLHPWEAPCDPAAPESAHFRDVIKKQLAELIVQQHISEFWLVMDQGLPCCVAEEILSLRESHPLRLNCVIPFEEQHLAWTEAARDHYFSVMERCDEEYLLATRFSIDCYQQSVQRLLEDCALLFVIWNGHAGDAADAITLARRSGCEVYSLNIETLNPTN